MEWQTRMPTVKIVGPYRNQSFFLEAWDAYFTG